MLGSIVNLATDVIKTAAAPVEIAVETARVVTKPVADAASETAQAVKEVTRDITEEKSF